METGNKRLEAPKQRHGTAHGKFLRHRMSAQAALRQWTRRWTRR